MPLRDAWGSTRTGQEAGGRGECMGETFIVFLGKEWTRWDKKFRTVATLHDFSELSA